MEFVGNFELLQISFLPSKAVKYYVLPRPSVLISIYDEFIRFNLCKYERIMDNFDKFK
jgi:hypothetical protein